MITDRLLPYRIRIRALEAFSGVLALYWGLLLWLPGSTFTASPSYEIMAALGSEETWGTFYIAIGVAQCLSIWQRCRWLRAMSMHLAVVGWGFASVMFSMANPMTHAPGIYGILALAHVVGAVWCRSSK
jgi:hypothetical protein